MSNLDEAWEALDQYLWYRIESGEYYFETRIGGQESMVTLTGLDDNKMYAFKVAISPLRTM